MILSSYLCVQNATFSGATTSDSWTNKCLNSYLKIEKYKFVS